MAINSPVLSSVLSFALLMSGTSATAWAATQDEPSKTNNKSLNTSRHHTQKSRHTSSGSVKDGGDENLTVRGHSHTVNGGALGPSAFWIHRSQSEPLPQQSFRNGKSNPSPASFRRTRPSFRTATRIRSMPIPSRSAAYRLTTTTTTKSTVRPSS